jgi:hypothetical protein
MSAVLSPAWRAAIAFRARRTADWLGADGKPKASGNMCHQCQRAAHCFDVDGRRIGNMRAGNSFVYEPQQVSLRQAVARWVSLGRGTRALLDRHLATVI